MQFQTPAISYYFDKECNNMTWETFKAVILNFFKFWGLEYISKPHLIMWGLQPPNPQELRPVGKLWNTVNKKTSNCNLNVSIEVLRVK